MDIPIVTQYLARHLLGLDESIDVKMLLSLDASNHPSHLTGTVEQYEANWWANNEAPSADDLLGFDCLSSCLAFHHKVSESKLKSASTGTSANN